MNPRELTPAEVAAMHRIHRTTVYRLIYSGQLISRRVGIQHRIAEADALALSQATPRTA